MTLTDAIPIIKSAQVCYIYVLIIDCKYNLAGPDLNRITWINFPLQRHLHPSIYFMSLMHHFITDVATEML